MIADSLSVVAVVSGLEALQNVEIPATLGNQDMVKLGFQILMVVLGIVKLFLHRPAQQMAAPNAATVESATTETYKMI